MARWLASRDATMAMAVRHARLCRAVRMETEQDMQAEGLRTCTKGGGRSGGGRWRQFKPDGGEREREREKRDKTDAVGAG